MIRHTESNVKCFGCKETDDNRIGFELYYKNKGMSIVLSKDFTLDEFIIRWNNATKTLEGAANAIQK